MLSPHYLIDILLRCAFTACLACVALPAESLLAQPPVKVMSFNIRFGAASDGENHWDQRRQLVAETLGVFDPDLVGLQEALPFQCEFLRKQFPTHGFFGRGREADATTGEFCAILFRRDRFENLDGGHFWLSATRDTPGSSGWDATLPRMVTWVLLRDRATARELIFANTHFDHLGKQARAKSAQVIQTWLSEHADKPVVMTGDFNCAVDSQPYQVLTGYQQDGARRLVDSYRVIHPQANDYQGTFGGWTGQRDGRRIDWILHTQDFDTLNAAIDYHQDRGRYPSDHYPVWSVIRLRD